MVWLCPTKERHENHSKERVRRGNGFSAVPVKFFDRFRSPPIPTVVMHLSQDSLGCTVRRAL